MTYYTKIHIMTFVSHHDTDLITLLTASHSSILVDAFIPSWNIYNVCGKIVFSESASSTALVCLLLLYVNNIVAIFIDIFPFVLIFHKKRCKIFHCINNFIFYIKFISNLPLIQNIQ